MRRVPLFAIMGLLPTATLAATPVTHFAPGGAGYPAIANGAPFSAAVMAGDTLYIAGTTDTDPATGKSPDDPKEGARRALDSIKRTVERAGLTMNDLVWVQVYTSDLSYYPAFNEVYRTYFTGPMPARAFVGSGSLLGGSHFEVMGIAVRPK